MGPADDFPSVRKLRVSFVFWLSWLDDGKSIWPIKMPKLSWKMAVKTEVLEVMVVLLRVWAQPGVTPEEKAPSTQLDPISGSSCVAISSAKSVGAIGSFWHFQSSTPLLSQSWHKGSSVPSLSTFDCESWKYGASGWFSLCGKTVSFLRVLTQLVGRREEYLANKNAQAVVENGR